MSYSVNDVRQDIINNLLNNQPKYTQFIKSKDKAANDRFFNLVYAYDYVIKKFASETYVNHDIDIYIDSIESSINGELCFVRQEHNKKRLETVLEVLNSIRYYLKKHFS